MFELTKEIEEIVLENNGNDPTAAYRAKIRSLYMNLKDKNNPALRAAVVSGAILPANLASMSQAVRYSCQTVTSLTCRLGITGHGIRGTESARPRHLGAKHTKCSRCRSDRVRNGQLQVWPLQRAKGALLSAQVYRRI